MGSVHPLTSGRYPDSSSPCVNCRLRTGCLPAELNTAEMARLDRLVTPRHRVRRGGYLVRAGTELQSLFAIRSGSLKSSSTDKDGREQIMGFHLAGDLLGLDAIGSGTHECDVIALEDSEVCRVPFAELQALSREIPALGKHLHRVISREIGRNHGVMLLLGSMHAPQRLAAFLLGLSQRMHSLGYSASQLVLRMTRHEIGSYLGLKLETVSRTFSSLQRESVIEVFGKEVRIIDPERLRIIVHGVDLPAETPVAKVRAKVAMSRIPARRAPVQAVAVAP